jgi:hypothetical protein
MFGHGSPSSFARALAPIALAFCALSNGSLSAQEFTVAQSVAVPAVTPIKESYTLRITWGGGDLQQWLGRIRLNGGALSGLKLLSNDADASASLWIENGELQIKDLAPHRRDAVELTADAGQDGQLTIELAAGIEAPPITAQVALATLAQRPYELRLDEHGGFLQAALVPQPFIQLSFQGDTQRPGMLIFAPGEQLSFELAAVLPSSLHGTSVDIQTTLCPARSKDVLWTDNQRLPVPVDGHPIVNLNVPLQQADGCYTVRVAISRPSGYFRDKFFPAATTPLAERSFEVVVLDSRSSKAEAAPHWNSVLEIDPTNPRWVERLPAWTQLRRLPGLNLSHGPLGSVRPGVADLPAGRFVELPPTVPGTEPHWQAYTLPLEAMGAPHILEVDYPADTEQHFGLSIVEPNAAGVIEGLHNGADVYVEGFGRSTQPKQTHRMLFWPRTQAPLLIVTNQHPTAPSRFGQIRVLKCTGPISPDPSMPVKQDRMIATYLASPALRESFGASQVLKNDSGEASRSVDDCQTSYEVATRLADYVRYGGFNTAVLSSLADGNSSQSTAQLVLNQPSEKGGSNLSRDADTLELALRVFDRAHLRLIPAIEFSRPMPRLEELRRTSDPQIAGIELVGPDGRTWLQTYGTRNGLAPYYNLLNPRVQEAMLQTAHDMVARYGRHAALGGLAVQLSGDGYAQLPPLDWALDDTTIVRFQQSTGVMIPNAGPDRFRARAAALLNEHSDQWRTWRAAIISDFYAKLAGEVCGQDERRLLLTTERLLNQPILAQRVRPNLLAETRLTDAFAELGLDRPTLERIPGLVLCPTLYVEPATPLVDRAIDLELSAGFAKWRQPATDSIGAALLYHRPDGLVTSSLAAHSKASLKVANDFHIQYQPLPYSAASRQPYLRTIMQGDSEVLLDGGDLLLSGQDEKLRNLRFILSLLPSATTARVSDTVKQPVVIRSFAEPNAVTLVAMNVSPWSVTTQVTLDLPQNTRLDPVAAPDLNGAVTANKALVLNAGRQNWSVTLEPYDVQAVRIATPGSKVAALQVDLSPAAQAELTASLKDLSDRDLSAPHEYTSLANPSFELPGRPIAGWQLKEGAAGGGILPDVNQPQDGKASLYIRSAGSATVESDPFPTPATGQLAMTVFARAKNMAPGTQLRLIFESDTNGRPKRIGFPVNGADLERPNDQWGRPLAVYVNNLPLDSRSKSRLVFEVTGPGEVWLDNIKLYDLNCPPKIYKDAQSEILQLVRRGHDAQCAYDAGQISDCQELLESYWLRFVKAYTPAPALEVATLPAKPQNSASGPPPANKEEPPAPGISDRIKRMVPILR